jgi:hypothetical protein
MSSVERKITTVIHSETFQVVEELEEQGEASEGSYLRAMLTICAVASPPAVLMRLRENGVEI